MPFCGILERQPNRAIWYYDNNVHERPLKMWSMWRHSSGRSASLLSKHFIQKPFFAPEFCMWVTVTTVMNAKNWRYFCSLNRGAPIRTNNFMRMEKNFLEWQEMWVQHHWNVQCRWNFTRRGRVAHLEYGHSKRNISTYKKDSQKCIFLIWWFS